MYKRQAWYGAGSFPLYDSKTCVVEEGKDSVRVAYTYRLATVPETVTEVVYEVDREGRIKTTAHYFGREGLPELPLFGMRFHISGTGGDFEWYGRGPEENYRDRNAGARLGILDVYKRQTGRRWAFRLWRTPSMVRRHWHI